MALLPEPPKHRVPTSPWPDWPAIFRTSTSGVFGGGDVSRGASLIVWAIADGRDLARHVDAYLALG